MTYSIDLAPTAARQLRKFDPHTRRRIQAVIDLLASNPRPPRATQLRGGSGEWRVRTGDYRIIYEIRDDSTCVDCTRILAAGAMVGATVGLVSHGPAADPVAKAP